MERERLRVLYVEDDELLVRQAAKYLRSDAGMEVECAMSLPDAQTVLAKCLPRFFDVAVVDRVLPGGDGASLIDRLQELFIPVMIVSGHLTDDIILELLARGVLSVFPKPFGARQLAQAIRNVVARANPGRELAKKYGFAPAEADLIAAAADGSTTEELVERLEIRPGTINSYWGRIFDQLERLGLPRTRNAATGLFVRFLRGED